MILRFLSWYFAAQTPAPPLQAGEGMEVWIELCKLMG